MRLIKQKLVTVLVSLGIIFGGILGEGVILPAWGDFPVVNDTPPLPIESGYGFLIAVGDLDGDDDLDIVTSISGPFTAAVLFNQGGEVFVTDTSAIPTLSNTREPPVLADFDGDGDLDLIFGTRSGSGGVNAAKDILLINDGTGTFTDVSATQLPNVNTLPIGKPTVADFDGDGDLDIFFANGRSTPNRVLQDNLFLNNGNGTFTDETSKLPTITEISHGAAAGDIDADGDTDIIVSVRFGRNKVLVNDGTGTFTDERTTQWPNNSTQSHREPFLVDVDGDGDLDFYEPTHGPTVSTFPQLNRLYLNDGTGIFIDVTDTNMPNVLTASGNFDAVGDIDGDSFPEIIAVANNAATFRVYSFNSSGTATLKSNSDVFSPAPGLSIGSHSSAIVDLDRDGDNDVLLSKVATSEIVFYRNPTIQNATVVINEIMWDEQEYIELRNVTPTAIEIGDLHITVGNDTEIVIDSPASISAHGFYLIADATALDTTVTPDEIDAMTFLQGGELVLLVDNKTGTVIDTANQAGGWFAGVNDVVGQSMERNFVSGNGNLPGNWHTSTGLGGGRIGTPGAANVPDPFFHSPGDVVINEIMWDGNEYIELFNVAGSQVDISGWKIHSGGNLEITIDNGATILPGDFYLIAQDVNTVNFTPDEIDGMTFLNSGELVELFDDNSTLIDKANQAGAWFAGVNDADGQSMERVNAIVPGTLSTNWQTTVGSVGGRAGTPGETNSVVPPPVGSPGDVVINEIMWDEAEYIELVNTTDTDIDIGDWVILAGGDTEVVIDAGAEIPAFGFYTIGTNGALTGCTPDEVDAMTLLQAGELVELNRDDGITIDIANQLGAWFAGANTAVGESMERSDSLAAGTVSGNWSTSTGSLCGRTGTAGASN